MKNETFTLRLSSYDAKTLENLSKKYNKSKSAIITELISALDYFSQDELGENEQKFMFSSIKYRLSK